MTIGMCYKLNGSVGQGGKNNPEDVKIVQNLLNERIKAALPVNGTCDSATIAAIRKFQAGFMLAPDGKVDPGGTSQAQLEGSGLVEMPANGGNGWYRYDTGDMSKSKIMHFGTSASVKTICDVAASVAMNMPGYAMGVGDISTASGANLGRHQTHKDGKNVDLRPFRMDKGKQPVSYQDTQYSRENTELMIAALLAHSNVSKVLFNDPQIINKYKPRVAASPGHDNHLHVIMKN
ncbi:MAG TPA: peptidoglycan-binding domain-containing protein [Pirellula sp.]|nr:peptidoglycan-binding domain-containing protein [Pirellula sp.]